jgi:ATP-dependent RNA helicase DDX56/DBP9
LALLDSLVIDEADLILSYGHDEDVKQILSGGYLPKVYQTFLMSATMTKDVETLKGIALRNPVSVAPFLSIRRNLLISCRTLGNFKARRRQG